MSVNTDPEHFPEKNFGKDIEQTGEDTLPNPLAHKGHPSQEWKNPPEKTYPKNKIAQPTIGRVVYVYHDKEDSPMAALVAKATPGSLEINAAVFAQSGDAILGGIQHVPHISEKPRNVPFCWDWMDYQKGQAAKTEELQAELDRRALDAKAKRA